MQRRASGQPPADCQPPSACPSQDAAAVPYYSKGDGGGFTPLPAGENARRRGEAILGTDSLQTPAIVCVAASARGARSEFSTATPLNSRRTAATAAATGNRGADRISFTVHPLKVTETVRSRMSGRILTTGGRGASRGPICAQCSAQFTVEAQEINSRHSAPLRKKKGLQNGAWR